MTTAPARPPARERLLDAAESLFYEHGIAATGVDAVIRRAGVAPATLYAHFSGKDVLVAAYLQRRHERWREAWDRALVRCGGDATSRAVALFDALESFPSQPGPARGCAFLAASVEVSSSDHPAHRWLVEDSSLLVDRLHRLAAEAGASDPAALASELLCLYDGALAARARRAAGGGDLLTLPPARDLAVAAVTRHRAQDAQRD